MKRTKPFWALFILYALISMACSISGNLRAADGMPTANPFPTITAIPAPTPTPETITCTVAAFEALNLRESPGTSAAVIRTLKPGDVLTILPTPPQGNWIYIRYGEIEGWINNKYCEVKP